MNQAKFHDDESAGSLIGFRRPVGVLLLLAFAFIAMVVWPLWANFYTDWLWFKDLGYQVVFSTELKAKISLGLTVGLLAALFIWVNFKLALRQSQKLATRNEPFADNSFLLNGQPVTLPDFSQVMRRLALPITLAVGLLTGLRAWGEWETWLRFRHQVPFGEADPIFGRDIGYYFFTLPALESVAGLLQMLVIISLIATGIIYLLRGSLLSSEAISQLRLFALSRGPRNHLLGLLALLFLVLAGQAYLAIPNLLYSTGGPVAGASYTDIKASMPLLYAQAGAAVLVAILAMACMFLSGSRLLWAGLGLYLLAIVAGIIYPGVLQRFSVGPNELALETPYIAHNIAATRKAFGLEHVEERELPGEMPLTVKDIQDNQRTINNIRLWDQKPLLDTFSQLQEIRTYYDFLSVDNDRYRINGELQQVMLSPRELSVASLPNRNWINEQLSFTHGFGLTVGPVNQVTPEGLPVLFVKDIPPVSTAPALKVDRPEIYFGEMSNDRVYVKTKAKEFNYPAGEENVFASYEGTGGVSIGSTWRQMLFASRFGDMKLLLSNDLTAESKVLFVRNIKERLNQIAPFLTFDNDPYLVISEGRLFWIADAYTESDRYPYAQRVNGINYIRNSVKAVVDAYHGDVKLYLADERDPLIQTWARIFPGMFKPLAEMSADLRAHLRYPEDIFKLQANIYSTWHMNQPQAFYNKEDQWTVVTVPETKEQAEAQMMDPYYTIMKLPSEPAEEFMLLLPFTPKSKDNLAAWMVARADGDHYGHLLVYRFPKQKLIYGPKQIVARINQDPEISRQLSLWDQRGSEVIHGTLLVIPVKESLIYVQPLYLRAETGKIPELKRIIVAAENRIVMESTLEAGLARVFGNAPAVATTSNHSASGNANAGDANANNANAGNATAAPPATDLQGLAAQAKQHYDRAVQAQRDGDWARYGEEIKQLGLVLEQMPKQK